MYGHPMYGHPDDHGPMATMADAHAEWHRNAGVPMGQPGCPQDACDGDWPDEVLADDLGGGPTPLTPGWMVPGDVFDAAKVPTPGTSFDPWVDPAIPLNPAF